MLDKTPDTSYYLIDKITEVYMRLRTIEQDGGSESQLRAEFGRLLDLLFDFNTQFLYLAYFRPDYRYFIPLYSNDFLIVSQLLYENIEPPENEANVKALAATINLPVSILVEKINSIKYRK